MMLWRANMRARMCVPYMPYRLRDARLFTAQPIVIRRSANYRPDPGRIRDASLWPRKINVPIIRLSFVAYAYAYLAGGARMRKQT